MKKSSNNASEQNHVMAPRRPEVDRKLKEPIVWITVEGQFKVESTSNFKTPIACYMLLICKDICLNLINPPYPIASRFNTAVSEMIFEAWVELLC